MLLFAMTTNATTINVDVEVAGEKLRGTLENSIRIFRGIPFAAPPLGELRWRAPVPHTPRTGVHSATEFASACMQTRYNTQWYEDIILGFDGDIDRAAAPNAVSEDCLYLNVWAPDIDTDEELPVMVFIYGGNNLGGWSYEPNYLGHYLADRGVIVVNIAYRLGVFGFLAHPDLTKESGTGSSGNYALLDQVAALQWIKDNISAFGGNADNVTVFGESAGGANISHLIVSPLATGLFRNAISQSGAFGLNLYDSLEREEAFGEGFSRSLGAGSIASLRELPAEAVLAGAESYYRQGTEDPEKMYFYGAVDGHVLPGYSHELYAKGAVNPVNLLLGSNADESLMYTEEATTQADVDSYIDNYFQPGSRARVMALLTDLPSARRRYAQLAMVREFGCTAQQQADAVSVSGKGNVYLYQFSRVRPGMGGKRLGAYHGAELPYVFDTHDDWLTGDEMDVALTDVIMDYWSNFARTGDPNGPGLIEWPKYAVPARATLELGSSVRVTEAPNRSLCELLRPPAPTP